MAGVISGYLLKKEVCPRAWELQVAESPSEETLSCPTPTPLRTFLMDSAFLLPKINLAQLIQAEMCLCSVPTLHQMEVHSFKNPSYWEINDVSIRAGVSHLL